jgi:hypothetical protein
MVAYLNAVPHTQRDSGGSLEFMAQPLAPLPAVPFAGGSLSVAPGTVPYADGARSVPFGGASLSVAASTVRYADSSRSAAWGSISEHPGDPSGSMAGLQPGTLSRPAPMAARLVEPVISNARCADDVRPATSVLRGPTLASDGRPLLEPRPASNLMLPGWQCPGKTYAASPLERRRSPSPGLQPSRIRVEPRRSTSPPARLGWGVPVVEVKQYPAPSPRQAVWSTDGRLLSKHGPLEAQPAAQPWQPQVSPPLEAQPAAQPWQPQVSPPQRRSYAL